jgi:hypothetical protein
MSFLKNLQRILKGEAYEEDRSEGDHYGKCFRCGAPSQASKVAPAGSWNAGQVISGRIWYCPRCDRMCCISCARFDGVNIVCPKCGSHFEQHPPSGN